MTQRARRLLSGCGLLTTLVATALCVLQLPAFQHLEYYVYDRLARWAPAHPPTGQVVIVDVDEQSLSTVGQWPWPRDRIGELIARLRDLGAATVALDIIFSEPDRSRGGDVSPDAALADVVRSGRAILGYGLTFASTGRREECVRHPFNVAVLSAGNDPAVLPFFSASRAVCNLPLIADAAERSGFLNAAPDSDGVLRRAPVLAEFGGRVYPSLALAAVTAGSGSRAATLRVEHENASTLQTLASSAGTALPAHLEVPLDGKSNLLIRYRGAKGTFPYVSAVDVLEGRIAADRVRDRVVLVGTTALGNREVVSTPLDTLFTGVEVQATLADNLIGRDFWMQPAHATGTEALAVLLIGGLISLAAARLGVLWSALLGVWLLGLVWGGALITLTTAGQVYSPLYPTAAVVVTTATVTLVGALTERSRADFASQQSIGAQRLMVQALLSLVESRDGETGRHSRRTREYTRLIAQALSACDQYARVLSPSYIDLLATLAPLHDIGKVGVRDAVLNKPGPLTPEEFDEMRQHPKRGRDVILAAEGAAGVRHDATLALAKDIAYTHHERWDGSGYPEGLKGAEIPIAGRILAVVDVYDAVRSCRPYRGPSPHDEVIQLIVRGSGTHFDPDVVEACVAVSEPLRALSESSLAADRPAA